MNFNSLIARAKAKKQQMINKAGGTMTMLITYHFNYST